ncbi:MAG: LamG domain-containing protein [Kiritimatiellia bacterium]
MKSISCIVFCLVFASLVSVRADLSDGLQLHYTFDSISGSNVYDESANAYTGVVFGSVITTNGIDGNAFAFNRNTYITVGNVLGLTGVLTQMTVSLWFNISTSAVPNTYLIAKIPHTTSDRGWKIDTLTDPGRLVSSVYANWPSEQVEAYTDDAVQLNDGMWHSLCATYDISPSSMSTRIYIDGSSAGMVYAGADRVGTHIAVDDPLASLVLGGRNGLIDTYDGMLDEVRIYNRILTAQEIAALYANQPSGAAEGSPYICLIGFSNDPQGDQDVTEFYNDETFYVSVQDVDLDENDSRTKVTAQLVQKGFGPGGRGAVKQISLERQESGIYTGSIPLNPFYTGEVRVIIHASTPGRLNLVRHSIIRIMSAAE